MSPKWAHGCALQWVVGGAGADLLIVNPFKSYADMAEPEPSFLKVLSDRLASEAAAQALWSEFTGAFVSSSHAIYTSRPDLSTPK